MWNLWTGTHQVSKWPDFHLSSLLEYLFCAQLLKEMTSHCCVRSELGRGSGHWWRLKHICSNYNLRTEKFWMICRQEWRVELGKASWGPRSRGRFSSDIRSFDACLLFCSACQQTPKEGSVSYLWPNLVFPSLSTRSGLGRMGHLSWTEPDWSLGD